MTKYGNNKKSNHHYIQNLEFPGTGIHKKVIQNIKFFKAAVYVTHIIKNIKEEKHNMFLMKIIIEHIVDNVKKCKM